MNKRTMTVVAIVLAAAAVAVSGAEAASYPTIPSDFQAGLVQLIMPWKLGTGVSSYTGYLMNSHSTNQQLTVVAHNTTQFFINNVYAHNTTYVYNRPQNASVKPFCHQSPLSSSSIGFEWLAKATYNGQQVLHTKLYDEWKLSLGTNGDIAVFVQGNTPARLLAQIPGQGGIFVTAVLDFYKFQAKPTPPSAFELPPYCTSAPSAKTMDELASKVASSATTPATPADAEAVAGVLRIQDLLAKLNSHE